jgi:hypothetical protein
MEGATVTKAFGFKLKSLTLSGPPVVPAEIQFTHGLNVVAGPSNTGKTFIAHCIDYMLGASDPPNRIPEAEGYETVTLEIERGDGEPIVLERSLHGGAFKLNYNGEVTTLREKHKAEDPETLSHFLLTLTGLAGKWVRTNKAGAKRTVSFRDIARLIMVDETDVIAERSPALSGQHQNRTPEISVFRLLLTGEDDSGLEEQTEPKVAKRIQDAKKEVLQSLIEQNRADLNSLGVEHAPDALSEALLAANNAKEAALQAVSSVRDMASRLEAERQAAWREVQRVESRIAVVTELQRRFELLEQQYESDLGRLEAIREASFRLGQIREERCPVCGARAEHHDPTHWESHASPEEVEAACTAESNKIRLLVEDLRLTLTANGAELAQLHISAEQQGDGLRSLESRLNDELKPRTADLISQLNAAQALVSRLAHASELHRREAQLRELLQAAESPIPKASKLPPASFDTAATEQFSRVVEDLLHSWNFPQLGSVTFSEKYCDIVIDGRVRSSHGKGVRALTHAAFTLGLMRYCRTESRPHPGFALIDSPLVVYREPDSSEGEEYHVKDAFYRNVAKLFADDQVIIMENEPPPQDLVQVNVISFTGADHGRRGFLPEQPPNSSSP